MSAGPDPRLQRLLGGAALAPLRARLRRRLQRGPVRDEIRLDGLADAEYLALAQLAGLRPTPAASVRVPVAQVDAALAAAGIAPSLRAALEALDGPIVDLQAGRREAARQWAGVADRCAPALAELLGRPAGLGLLKRLSRSDLRRAGALCERAAAVLDRLPAAGLARARLAAQALGDAHGLDDGQPVATLVLAALRPPAAGGTPDGQERRRDRWAAAGVLVNELARPALALNLPAAGEAGEPAYLSLRWLLRRPRPWPLAGQVVFACENPNLVAIAADELGPRCSPLVCTDGMPAAAQRSLLRQLAESGAELHYHGDFDWPGIAIANHVLRSFGARPWRLDAPAYRQALAQPGGRGHRLAGEPVAAHWDAELLPAMRDAGFAVSEEGVAHLMLEDLRT